jgi:MinD superfamily P-loop ATPase
MIISIASGKGGTGKTTVATNFALSLDIDIQLLDCDVEEPNAHIFLNPHFEKRYSAFILVPRVDDSKCTYCGKCSEICRYNVIAVLKDKVLIFPELCSGCGGCSLLCPEGAITEENREIGVIEEGTAGAVRVEDHARGGEPFFHFGHGRLNIGEARAVPVIKQLKKRIDPGKLTIIDSPPGTSCPVIESVKGSDFCILVTEPTPFGLNDLILAVEALRKLGIPHGIVINRCDIGDKEVTKYCKAEDIPILMEIPVERKIAEAYSRGIPFVTLDQSWKPRFKELYGRIQNLV